MLDIKLIERSSGSKFLLREKTPWRKWTQSTFFCDFVMMLLLTHGGILIARSLMSLNFANFGQQCGSKHNRRASNHSHVASGFKLQTKAMTCLVGDPKFTE